MDSQNEYTHRMNWFDLSENTIQAYYRELSSLLICNLHGVSHEINYARIFKNGLTEEAINKAFIIANLKLNMSKWNL